jgi:hypothetical protein
MPEARRADRVDPAQKGILGKKNQRTGRTALSGEEKNQHQNENENKASDRAAKTDLTTPNQTTEE